MTPRSLAVAIFFPVTGLGDIGWGRSPILRGGGGWGGPGINGANGRQWLLMPREPLTVGAWEDF